MTAPVAPPGLKVLTFNAGLLSVRLGAWRVFEQAHHDARLAAMPRALAGTGADVLALQEVYRPEDRAALVAGVRATHPFAAEGPASTRALLGHGMLLLSRLPLDGVRFEPLEDPLPDERPLIGRGLLTARVDAGPLGRVALTNAHLTAGGLFAHPEHARVDRVRERQLRQAMRAARRPDAEARLLVGDLNCGPEASAGNYATLLSEGFMDGQATTASGSGLDVTWDPGAKLNQGTRHGRECPPQRIDHVLLAPGSARHRLADARVVLDEASVPVAGGPVTLSDHYGWVATLVEARPA